MITLDIGTYGINITVRGECLDIKDLHFTLYVTDWEIPWTIEAETCEINRECGERKTIGKLNELFNQTLLESYLIVFWTIVAIPQFYQLSLSQSLSLCFRQLCAETSQVKKCLHFDPQMFSVAAISPLNPEALVSNDALICHIKLLNIIISELYATNLTVFFK